jgi:hypothetical protein
MLGSGLRAVLMKVAGLGLKVEDVGKELSVMRPKLARLVSWKGYLSCDGADWLDFRRNCMARM